MPTPNPPETPLETPLGPIFYQGHSGTPPGGTPPGGQPPCNSPDLNPAQKVNLVNFENNHK